MSGFGTYPAGVGLGGYDPSSPAPPALLHVPPEARFYNLTTKDYLLDAYGQASPMDAIDQGMALSMGVDQGSCLSSKTTGNTLRKIEYLAGDDLGSNVRMRVMQANPLQRLVANGDAAIRTISYWVDTGTLYVLVEYTKPKTDPNTSRYAALK